LNEITSLYREIGDELGKVRAELRFTKEGRLVEAAHYAYNQ
jgi:hypothetical protein